MTNIFQETCLFSFQRHSLEETIFCLGEAGISLWVCSIQGNVVSFPYCDHSYVQISKDEPLNGLSGTVLIKGKSSPHFYHRITLDHLIEVPTLHLSMTGSKESGWTIYGETPDKGVFPIIDLCTSHLEHNLSSRVLCLDPIPTDLNLSKYTMVFLDSRYEPDGVSLDNSPLGVWLKDKDSKTLSMVDPSREVLKSIVNSKLKEIYLGECWVDEIDFNNELEFISIGFFGLRYQRKFAERNGTPIEKTAIKITLPSSIKTVHIKTEDDLDFMNLGSLQQLLHLSIDHGYGKSEWSPNLSQATSLIRLDLHSNNKDIQIENIPQTLSSLNTSFLVDLSHVGEMTQLEQLTLKVGRPRENYYYPLKKLSHLRQFILRDGYDPNLSSRIIFNLEYLISSSNLQHIVLDSVGTLKNIDRLSDLKNLSYFEAKNYIAAEYFPLKNLPDSLRFAATSDIYVGAGNKPVREWLGSLRQIYIDQLVDWCFKCDNLELLYVHNHIQEVKGFDFRSLSPFKYLKDLTVNALDFRNFESLQQLTHLEAIELQLDDEAELNSLSIDGNHIPNVRSVGVNGAVNTSLSQLYLMNLASIDDIKISNVEKVELLRLAREYDLSEVACLQLDISFSDTISPHLKLECHPTLRSLKIKDILELINLKVSATGLIDLSLFNSSKLESLDLTDLSKLERLECSPTQCLQSLSLSGCSNLSISNIEDVISSTSGLSRLDLSYLDLSNSDLLTSRSTALSGVTELSLKGQILTVEMIEALKDLEGLVDLFVDKDEESKAHAVLAHCATLRGDISLIIDRSMTWISSLNGADRVRVLIEAFKTIKDDRLQDDIFSELTHRMIDLKVEEDLLWFELYKARWNQDSISDQVDQLLKELEPIDQKSPKVLSGLIDSVTLQSMTLADEERITVITMIYDRLDGIIQVALDHRKDYFQLIHSLIILSITCNTVQACSDWPDFRSIKDEGFLKSLINQRLLPGAKAYLKNVHYKISDDEHILFKMSHFIYFSHQRYLKQISRDAKSDLISAKSTSIIRWLEKLWNRCFHNSGVILPLDFNEDSIIFYKDSTESRPISILLGSIQDVIFEEDNHSLFILDSKRQPIVQFMTALSIPDGRCETIFVFRTHKHIVRAGAPNCKHLVLIDNIENDLSFPESALPNMSIMSLRNVYSEMLVIKHQSIVHLSMSGDHFIAKSILIHNCTELKNLQIKVTEYFQHTLSLSSDIKLKSIDLEGNVDIHDTDKIVVVSHLESYLHTASINWSTGRKCIFGNDDKRIVDGHLYPNLRSLSLDKTRSLTIQDLNKLEELSLRVESGCVLKLHNLQNLYKLNLDNAFDLTWTKQSHARFCVESIHLINLPNLNLSHIDIVNLDIDFETDDHININGDLIIIDGLLNLKELNIDSLCRKAVIQNCPNLEYLTVRTIDTPPVLKNLENLKDLTLTYEELIDIDHLSQFKKLEYVNLKGCNEIRNLEPLRSLRNLRDVVWRKGEAASVMTYCAGQRGDREWVEKNIAEMIETFDYVDDKVRFFDEIISALSLLDEQDPDCLLNIYTAGRALTNPIIDENSWYHWTALVLKLHDRDALENHLNLVLNDYETRDDVELRISPIIRQIASQNRQEYSWVDRIVADCFKRLKELEFEQFVIPVAALFYAYRERDDLVKEWVDRGTQLQTPTWSALTFKELAVYAAKKKDWASVKMWTHRLEKTEQLSVKLKLHAQLCDQLMIDHTDQAIYHLSRMEESAQQSDYALKLADIVLANQDWHLLPKLVMSITAQPDSLFELLNKTLSSSSEISTDVYEEMRLTAAAHSDTGRHFNDPEHELLPMFSDAITGLTSEPSQPLHLELAEEPQRGQLAAQLEASLTRVSQSERWPDFLSGRALQRGAVSGHIQALQSQLHRGEQSLMERALTELIAHRLVREGKLEAEDLDELIEGLWS